MSSTDKDWAQWGAKDPYYGVVSHSEFESERIETNRDRFFASGEAFVSKIVLQAEKLFGAVNADGNALDFGCGVARLTIPLARQFKHVDGLDVSPHMLNEAKANCEACGIDNANFRLSNGDLNPRHWPRRYDFVNSYIVLQHIPVRRGYLIIDSLLDLVEEQGIAMLHVSLRRKLPALRTIIYQVRDKIPLAQYAANLVQSKSLFTPQMQMNEYDLVRVLEIFSRHNMTDVSITLERHRGVETARLLAQKRAQC